MVGFMAWWQEDEVSGPIAPAVHSPPTFFFLFILGLQHNTFSPRLISLSGSIFPDIPRGVSPR